MSGTFDPSKRPEGPVIFEKNTGRLSVTDLFGSVSDIFLLKNMGSRAERHLADKRKQLVVFSFDWIATNINIFGVYELHQLDLFAQWIAPYRQTLAQAAAIDIGANIGNHSLFFADYFKRIYSFEPNRRTFNVLSLNAALASNITCFNVGISDSDGDALLDVDAANTGGSVISDRPTATTQSITLRRLDPLIDPDDTIALIKIDVEGHEFQALSGSEAIIRRHKPLILFEQHRDEFVGGSTRTIDLLRKFGYRKFAVIETAPVAPAGLPRPVRIVWRNIVQFLEGKTSRLVIKEHFEPGFYSFIIAVPDWVATPSV